MRIETTGFKWVALHVNERSYDMLKSHAAARGQTVKDVMNAMIENDQALLACVEYVVNMLGADAAEHFGFDAEQWQRVVALLPPERSILELE